MRKRRRGSPILLDWGEGARVQPKGYFKTKFCCGRTREKKKSNTRGLVEARAARWQQCRRGKWQNLGEKKNGIQIARPNMLREGLAGKKNKGKKWKLTKVRHPASPAGSAQDVLFFRLKPFDRIPKSGGKAKMFTSRAGRNA